MTRAHPISKQEQIQALRGLLKTLPCWRLPQERRLFLEFSLHGHPMLDRLHFGGTAVELATEVAMTLHALDYQPLDDGRHPVCAIVAEVRERGYNAIPQVASALEDPALVHGYGEARPARSPASPYPGLMAYDWGRDPRLASLFFGRETETEELVDTLRQRPSAFHLVTGSSGSGKSSLVKAGLWRRLQDPESGPEPISGCRDWVVSAMVPNLDGDAFLSLLNSVRELSPVRLRPGPEGERLRCDARAGCCDAFDDLLISKLAGHPRWLLILDQMEELFAPEAADYAEDFIRFIALAVEHPRFSVVATLRSDFLHRFIDHPRLHVLLSSGSQMFVRLPGRRALERMTARPAAMVGVTLEEGLVDRLVEETSAAGGGLALLAAALQDLWACLRAEQTDIGLRDYRDEVGGLAGVLTRRAERGLTRMVQSGMARAEAEATLRRVFAKLISLDRDDENPIRRRQDLNIWPAGGPERQLVDVFSEDTDDPRDAVRLLICGERAGVPSVEIAHELLLSLWPPLAEWIESRREAMIRRNEILRDAARWEREARADHYLPSPALVEDMYRKLDAASLWDGLREDRNVAAFLARDDVGELTDLVVNELAALAPNPRASDALPLLACLANPGRTWEVTKLLVHRLSQRAPEVAAWLRAGLTLVLASLESGGDERWHRRRLGIGDLMAALGDARPGVGLCREGLPDIDWVEIASGPFIWQNGEQRDLRDYAIARYPLTNEQYCAFTQASDYGNSDWWLPEFSATVAAEAANPQSNRPRSGVSWVEAVAFCRWLSAKHQRAGLLSPDQEIRLPTDYEWEKAARGGQGFRYPWPGDYVSSYANVDESKMDRNGLFLRETTAVGLYPKGASPYGVLDCAGNVWEWCCGPYDEPGSTSIGEIDTQRRSLRGGSWYRTQDFAQATVRNSGYPLFRHDGIGFRVARADRR